MVCYYWALVLDNEEPSVIMVVTIAVFVNAIGVIAIVVITTTLPDYECLNLITTIPIDFIAFDYWLIKSHHRYTIHAPH